MTTETTLEGWVDKRDFQIKVRKNGKRKERYYATYHPCGHKSYLRIHDARNGAVRQCDKCRRVARAKKGYKAAMAKHGGQRGLNLKLAKWQRDNLSKPEQTVLDWLIEAGLVEEFHFRCQECVQLTSKTTYILDFSIGQNKGIEVYGFWHKKTKGAKDARLAKIMNILFVDADLIVSDPATAKAAILEFIK